MEVSKFLDLGVTSKSSKKRTNVISLVI
jgi:hypothetical protein